MILKTDEAKNALARVKAALNKNNERKAIELVQQIFEAGYQRGIDAIFNPVDDEE